MTETTEEDRLDGGDPEQLDDTQAEISQEPQEPQEPQEDVVAEEAPAPQLRVVDKRRFARLLGFGAGRQGDAVEEQQVERVRSQVARAEATARAEVEAARDRLERHFEVRLHTAKGELVETMLPVFDNLELALETPGAEDSTLYDGVAATRKMFLKALADMGIEPIDAEGVPFDPALHEAVEAVEVTDPEQDGLVLLEIRRGFRSGERLVRASSVRVGRLKAE